MSRFMQSAAAALVLALVPQLSQAQDNEKSTAVKGGIQMKGWMGVVDAKEAKAGLTVDSAKFVSMGAGMHATTGPAITYWNPSMKAKGDYTVKATFSEREYMGLNNHPHPYGIVMAGNDMGAAGASYLYCAAYGNGNFIVRGFGPAPFQMNGPRGGASEAVNKAEAKGKPVTQEIAMSVKGDKVSCIINGKEVASYTKAEVTGEGKLKTTDGVVGFRMGHNTDAHIAGFSLTKN
ncbi:hypothetical protein [Gemmatimonas sp.]|jgi:hypothetical protein|uniref:hypothetical protein n=1 Tax=Gemmatimonas sp. TaxID=1962908 RepID=UPI0031BD6BA0|nr:hypothetical protein [Gemmatimonas sp.]